MKLLSVLLALLVSSAASAKITYKGYSPIKACSLDALQSSVDVAFALKTSYVPAFSDQYSQEDLIQISIKVSKASKSLYAQSNDCRTKLTDAEKLQIQAAIADLELLKKQVSQ